MVAERSFSIPILVTSSSSILLEPLTYEADIHDAFAGLEGAVTGSVRDKLWPRRKNSWIGSVL